MAYAKEKLSTFWMAATALPLMVIFVKGVWLRASLPYQSIARTEAWPPNQLQLLILGQRSNINTRLEIALTHLMSASPAYQIVGVRFVLSIHAVIFCARTQISILSLEFARAPSWGSHVLASCISSPCKLSLNRIHQYNRQKRTSPVSTKRLNGGSGHSQYRTSAPIFFCISAWWRKLT